MKITNKDLIQSYIITQARYDFSIHEKRILYSIIEMLQSITEGKKLNQKYYAQKNLFGDYTFEIPIKACLKDEKDNNHNRVKQALRDLESKKFEYEDDEVWQLIRIVQEPEIYKNKEVMKFKLHNRLVDAFLDFSKGFSKYEFLTAMQFNSVYAMRFYELLSGQTRPITYSIQKLKIMFQLQDKYSKVNDFFARVIDTAKRELDEKSPYSFEYKPIKDGRKIISITFYPVYNANKKDPQLEYKALQKQTSLHWDLDTMVIHYLKEQYYFSSDEIKNNLPLFKSANEKLDLLYEISVLKPKCSTKNNPKGYLINTLKKMVVTKNAEKV